MRKSVIITTPFPTFEETVRELKIPPARAKWLKQLADSIVAKYPPKRKKKAEVGKATNGKPKQAKRVSKRSV